MKQYSILTTIIILVLTTALIAGTTKKYGKTLTLKKTTPISAIMEAPEKYNGKKLLVEGTIVDVCEKRGCWIDIKGDKEFEALRFKVEDGVMSFPVAAKGKKARVEGVLAVETVSVEDQITQGKKHAEETGEKFDPKSVKEAKTYIQINGLGAEVK